MTYIRMTLRRLSDQATPGPWEADDRDGNVRSASKITPIAYDCGSADAEFIAAARQAIPDLLDALDQAEDRIDSLRAQIGIEIRSRDDWETNAEQAEALLQAVREMHAPSEYGCQQECRESHGDIQWPCATIRALDGEP